MRVEDVAEPAKVGRNDAATIEDATRRALASAEERERMEALIVLEGVGVPTASTLLHFAFPDDYPILDVRALESLGSAPDRVPRDLPPSSARRLGSPPAGAVEGLANRGDPLDAAQPEAATPGQRPSVPGPKAMGRR